MQTFLFDSVDSTNEAAKRMLREGIIREDAFLLAREQTAGRGTRGRTWLSPRDAGIYLTVVQPMRAASARLTTDYTRAAGVACAEVLAEATGLPVRIKPVNDLYLHGRKLGGILTETLVQNGTVEALLTGVGVNVRLADRPLFAATVESICLEEALGPIGIGHLDLQALTASLVAAVVRRQTEVCLGQSRNWVSVWNLFTDSATFSEQE